MSGLVPRVTAAAHRAVACEGMLVRLSGLLYVEPDDPLSAGVMRNRSDGRLTALLERAKAGDDEALAAWLIELRLILTRAATAALRDPASADLVEDVVQESLRRMLRSVQTCRATSDGQVIRWALTSLNSATCDVLRGSLPQVFADALVAIVGPSPDASNEAPVSWVASLFEKARDELPDAAKDLISRRAEEGETWVAIAQELGVAESTVRKRWRRLERHMGEAMLSRVDEVPPGERERVRRLIERWLSEDQR